MPWPAVVVVVVVTVVVVVEIVDTAVGVTGDHCWFWKKNTYSKQSIALPTIKNCYAEFWIHIEIYNFTDPDLNPTIEKLRIQILYDI